MRLLDVLAYRRGELFEYWGHVASLVPIRQYPLLRHRMLDAKPAHRVQQVIEEHPGYLDAILEEVRRRGPLTVSDLEDPGQRTGPWWGYGKGKIALEWHFTRGNLAVRERRNFARVYDLSERVIPEEVLAAHAPAREDAHREMLRIAARALGIGTLSDLANYYRIRTPQARPRLKELVSAGELHEIAVEGWDQPAYLLPGAESPRKSDARALISPFDSLIWSRERTERLFAFHYRIEIYVPEPERRYGYYVLPFLLGENLVARVDLKSDRERGALRVRGAYLEEGRDALGVASELASELRLMAEWLALPRVEVEDRGDLAHDLGRALGSGPRSQ